MRRTFLVVLLVLAGCSGQGEQPPKGVELTATLTTPIDIDLRWTGEEPGTAVQVVEFATDLAGPWTILEYLPADRRTFTHPELLPQTPFYYRVRPVLGPASNTASVRLGAASFDVSEDLDLNWAAPKPMPDAVPGTPGGAPTDLTVTRMEADGVLLKWKDNASDEEGYLVEMLPDGAADWKVTMTADADIASVGVILQDKDRSAAFRVRAYRYGESSNVAHQKTGGEAG